LLKYILNLNLKALLGIYLKLLNFENNWDAFGKQWRFCARRRIGLNKTKTACDSWTSKTRSLKIRSSCHSTSTSVDLKPWVCASTTKTALVSKPNPFNQVKLKTQAELVKAITTVRSSSLWMQMRRRLKTSKSMT